MAACVQRPASAFSNPALAAEAQRLDAWKPSRPRHSAHAPHLSPSSGAQSRPRPSSAPVPQEQHLHPDSTASARSGGRTSRVEAASQRLTSASLAAASTDPLAAMGPTHGLYLGRPALYRGLAGTPGPGDYHRAAHWEVSKGGVLPESTRTQELQCAL